jgi:hypothetical protein
MCLKEIEEDVEDEGMEALSSVSALHRCIPTALSEKFPVLKCLQYSPFEHVRTFQVLGDCMHNGGKSFYEKFCVLYGNALLISEKSKHVAVEDIDEIKELLFGISQLPPNQECVKPLQAVAADIMIRHRIVDKKLFSSFHSLQAVQVQMYRTFVLSSPAEKKSFDICYDILKRIPDQTFYTLLYFYEYLTQNTINGLVHVADRPMHKSARNSMMLSLRLKDFQTNETEIASLFGSLMHRDELLPLIDLNEVQKLSETSQIQICAHLFFVDSFEDFSGVRSTVFFIGVCAGINL